MFEVDPFFPGHLFFVGGNGTKIRLRNGRNVIRNRMVTSQIVTVLAVPVWCPGALD